MVTVGRAFWTYPSLAPFSLSQSHHHWSTPTPLSGHQLYKQTSSILSLGSGKIHGPSYSHRPKRTFRASLGSIMEPKGPQSETLRSLLSGGWLILNLRWKELERTRCMAKPFPTLENKPEPSLSDWESAPLLCCKDSHIHCIGVSLWRFI